MTDQPLFVKIKEFASGNSRVSGACVFVEGNQVTGFIKSKSAHFDWDLSDDLAGLETELCKSDIIVGGDGLIHSVPCGLFQSMIDDHKGRMGIGRVFLLKEGEWVEE